jgi:hypothetical protein
MCIKMLAWVHDKHEAMESTLAALKTYEPSENKAVHSTLYACTLPY